MTFYDQDDPRRPRRGGEATPPSTEHEEVVDPEPVDVFDDPDIWSSEDPAVPDEAAAPVARRDRPEPGPAGARPASRPRRGPRRPAVRPRRPGRPGAVPTEPVSGQVPVVPGPGAVLVEEDLDEDPYQDVDDGHDYVDLPREGRVPRWVAALIVVVLLAGLFVGGANWWYQGKIDPPGPAGENVAVVVPQGSSTSQIGDLLANEDVISSSLVFNFYAGRKGAGPFQAGTYQFQRNSDFDLALSVLEAGPGNTPSAETATVTIPEGFTIADILARVHERVPRLSVEELQAALDEGKVATSLKPDDEPSYEGLLFPATYEVGADDDAVEVLTMMTAEMEKRANALGIEQARTHIKNQWGLDLSAYEMIIVASMIQFEAAVPADAPKIGTVTYNRLEGGWTLGFDSTSIYEAELAGELPSSVDYTIDTPYNTRTRQGLPPTPIAAPGEYALVGAMQPLDEGWFYFVLTEPNVVSFSVDEDQFLRDKQKCKDNNLGCG